MLEPQTPSTQVELPAASLHAMRKALESEIGPDAAAGALQNAGHAAGDAFYALLAAGADVAGLDEAEYWRRLNDLFAQRGWGRLHFEPQHEGIGALESGDWAEASPESGALRPCCHFTTGLLANILGRTAGQDVGVIEVECRSRGDLRCLFFFGGAEALQRVYASLSAGRGVDGALAELA